MKRENKCGIYCILNLVNNKRYIGYAINIDRRWDKHISPLRNNKHTNSYLQHSWNKYGEENFKLIVIQELEKNEELLKSMEIYWIAYYNSFVDDGGGYNLTRGGEGVFHPSLETRKKISDGNKGREVSKETREKISRCLMGRYRGEDSPSFGKTRSEEFKKKMSQIKKGHPAWNKGKKSSEDAIRKMSISKSGPRHHMYGKHLTEQNKKNIGIANTNPSKETRIKMAEGLQGRKLQEDTSSKYVGVHLVKRYKIKKWAATIRYLKKTYNLGYFEYPIEAALAYNEAAQEFYGWKAKLNNISQEEMEFLWKSD
jgi:group I intron endonuclease